MFRTLKYINIKYVLNSQGTKEHNEILEICNFLVGNKNIKMKTIKEK